MTAREDLAQAEIERILRSDTFRNSDSLRRLLRFLADATLSGEAEQLKEYTIGIDALGKPASYDPRQDSVVRIQVGRLRQKLAEYYRTDGKENPFVVEIPKGRFKLNFESHPQPSTLEHSEPARTEIVEAPAKSSNWRRASIVFASALALALIWGIYTGVKLAEVRAANAPLRGAWTPELTELWKPFLVSNRPLIISVAAPLFVGFQGMGLYRDLDLNSWDEVLRSPKMSAMRKALNNPPLVLRYYYTGIGVPAATFYLGKLLTVSSVNVSVARSGQLSWQQLTDNNVLFIGSPRLYTEEWNGLQLELDIVQERFGIKILHPQPGEPDHLEDHFPNISALENSSARDDGEVYALITHTSGPLGTGDILSFSANHSPGVLAGVQSFTNPNLARVLVAKLRRPNGQLPRFYQIVLKAKYIDAVPTEVSYLLHRELRAERRPTAK